MKLRIISTLLSVITLSVMAMDESLDLTFGSSASSEPNGNTPQTPEGFDLFAAVHNPDRLAGAPVYDRAPINSPEREVQPEKLKRDFTVYESPLEAGIARLAAEEQPSNTRKRRNLTPQAPKNFTLTLPPVAKKAPIKTVEKDASYKHFLEMLCHYSHNASNPFTDSNGTRYLEYEYVLNAAKKIDRDVIFNKPSKPIAGISDKPTSLAGILVLDALYSGKTRLIDNYTSDKAAAFLQKTVPCNLTLPDGDNVEVNPTVDEILNRQGDTLLPFPEKAFPQPPSQELMAKNRRNLANLLYLKSTVATRPLPR